MIQYILLFFFSLYSLAALGEPSKVLVIEPNVYLVNFLKKFHYKVDTT